MTEATFDLIEDDSGNLKLLRPGEEAVEKVISDGLRTQDIASPAEPQFRTVSTREMGDAIAAAVLG